MPEFEIDRVPVTNGAYREFVEEAATGARVVVGGGLGVAHTRARGTTPLLDRRWPRTALRSDRADRRPPAGDVRRLVRGGRVHALGGGRLPTEAEWEKAASWDAGAAAKARFPWGDEPPSAEVANLDQLGFGPAAAGAFPAGAAPCGALGMIGDAWEWTGRSSGLSGFRGVPLPRVLGGLLRPGLPRPARRLVGDPPAAIRNTFRNWDFPSGDRSSPASAAHGTSDGRPPHTRARGPDRLVPRGPSPRDDGGRRPRGPDARAEGAPAEVLLRRARLRAVRPITTLPEYYPTRCERSILNRRSPEIADATGAAELVELGSGSASKTRALLYAMAGAGTLRRYVPVDVSRAWSSARRSS